MRRGKPKIGRHPATPQPGATQLSELAVTLKAFAKPKQCEPENAERAEPSHPSPMNFFALSATSAFQKIGLGD